MSIMRALCLDRRFEALRARACNSTIFGQLIWKLLLKDTRRRRGLWANAPPLHSDTGPYDAERFSRNRRGSLRGLNCGGA
jgi:hypothetical protein